MTIENHDVCEPLLFEHNSIIKKDLKPFLIKRTESNKSNDDSTTLPNSYSYSLFKRKRIYIIVISIVILIYMNSSVISWDSIEKVPNIHGSHEDGVTEYSNITPASFINNTITLIPPPGYLVWTDNCQIPIVNPFASDMMKHFKKEKYEGCSSKEPLTTVTYNLTAKKYILQISEKLKEEFTKTTDKLECCYQVIKRSGSGKMVDGNFSTSKCYSFNESIHIESTSENILVKCLRKNSKTYINAHAMIPERPDIRKRLNEWKAKDIKRPLSVLMIGIDSISRQNLIRAMPKTAQYLYDSNWFELNGYNKIDDNTFPNFMALFAGYNSSLAYEKCNPKKVGYLDECSLIWKDFRKYGYVTAYAEDEEIISTFNFLKVGFKNPPTDYYIRPLLLAAEKNLPIKRKNGLTFCLGYQHSADYIYDYAIELSKTYSEDPYFGLFWTNSFSHNAISDPSSMDYKMLEYFHKFENNGILNHSAIIFFSDHGIRFGPTRELYSGRMEERLPFFFMWLPSWFKNENPEFVDGLNVNKNRLTNPYDVHMTLKHILELSGRAENLSQALSCPNCQTLFTPVSENRSCEDVAIDTHWCTCIPYKSTNKNSEIVQQAVNLTINNINNLLLTYKNGMVSKKCAKIYIDQIKFANRAVNLKKNSTDPFESYQFAFKVKPGGGIFEATVRYHMITKEFVLTDNISRINSYAKDSKCISDGGAKKFCFCKKSGKTG